MSGRDFSNMTVGLSLRGTAHYDRISKGIFLSKGTDAETAANVLSHETLHAILAEILGLNPETSTKLDELRRWLAIRFTVIYPTKDIEKLDIEDHKDANGIFPFAVLGELLEVLERRYNRNIDKQGCASKHRP